MIKFNYCGTHIKDEEYMNKMSSNGWNAKSLVEGFWTFEKGKSNEYTYRVYYFRGMTKEAIKKKIKDLEKEEIEFVHKYSFWGIFKSKKDFQLYNENEQLEVSNKIRKPMLAATIICPIIIIICIILSRTISKIFIPITVLISIYYLICLYLMVEYTKLINSLRKSNNKEV